MSMTDNMPYRKEFKYICSATHQAIIVSKLKNIGILDCHVNSNGYYIIRSVYFDDYSNSCFAENESGSDPREKWRIRAYNLNDGYISLECKQKKSGHTRKIACSITKEELNCIIKGQMLPYDSERVILNKFLVLSKTKRLVPKMIVEYKRIPYTIGKDIRITFDADIFVSREIDSFLNHNLPKQRVMDSRLRIMEIKYNNELPQFVSDIVSFSNMQWTSFSKYYFGRMKST